MIRIKTGICDGEAAYYATTGTGKYIHADGKAYSYTCGGDYNSEEYTGWFTTYEEAEIAVERYKQCKKSY